MSTFLVGLVVGVLLMVMRVNAGYESGTNKENRMKNIKNKVIGTTRRGRIMRVAAVLVLVPALAFAAMLLWTMGVTGTIGVKANPVVAWSDKANGSPTNNVALPVVVGDGTGNGGTVTVTSGRLNLNVTNAYPDTSVLVESRVMNDTSGLVFAGLDLGPNVTATVVPGQTLTGGEPSLACGGTVTAITSTMSSPKTSAVAFRVAIPAGTAGGTLTLPTDAAAKVMPKGQWDALSAAEKTALCK